ncbi:MAG TPA: FixH family protein [Puia sp.]|nr:FixH family protein [Puia sp.]
MNWGNKLLLVFVVFGGMISYMVYRCMRTPVDLVSNQYYKDELAYQKVIDGSRQANALSARVVLEHVTGAVRLTLPMEMKGKAVKGRIVFYCPNDVTRDRSFPLGTDGSGRQEIVSGAVPNGHYTVKVSWESGGVDYFMEQPFVIQ